MRVYKPRPTARTWRVEIRDANGRPRRLGGFKDRKATEELGRRVERLVAMRAGGESLDTEMVRWLEGIPVRLRKRLGKLGLLEARTVAASQPLSAHLDDWHAAIIAKGNTAKYAKLVKHRAKAMFEACGFTMWSDLEPGRVQTYLGDLKESGKSIRTANFHLQAARQFCRWMVRERRATENPLGHLQGDNPKKDRRRTRRALSVDEFAWLVSTTEKAADWQGIGGAERALLYRFASETGLRADEIRSLTKASFDLEGKNPTVTVIAAYSKRRRDDVLPVRPSMVESVKSHLANKVPDAKAFNLPTRTADMLRADLTAARAEWMKGATTPEEAARRRKSDFLAFEDDAGRVFDFHALRGQFASNLAAGGVHPKTAQELLRHSTVELTLGIYTHLPKDSLSAALGVLPEGAHFGAHFSLQRSGPLPHRLRLVLQFPEELKNTEFPGRRSQVRCVKFTRTQQNPKHILSALAASFLNP